MFEFEHMPSKSSFHPLRIVDELSTGDVSLPATDEIGRKRQKPAVQPGGCRTIY